MNWCNYIIEKNKNQYTNDPCKDRREDKTIMFYYYPGTKYPKWKFKGKVQ